jgi:hypothetical protein
MVTPNIAAISTEDDECDDLGCGVEGDAEREPDTTNYRQ